MHFLTTVATSAYSARSRSRSKSLTKDEKVGTRNGLIQTAVNLSKLGPAPNFFQNSSSVNGFSICHARSDTSLYPCTSDGFVVVNSSTTRTRMESKYVCNRWARWLVAKHNGSLPSRARGYFEIGRWFCHFVLYQKWKEEDKRILLPYPRPMLGLYSNARPQTSVLLILFFILFLLFSFLVLAKVLNLTLSLPSS